MKSIILALAALWLASAAVAQAPPAPSFTVAATDIKQLQFDITPVTRVHWYELWFQSSPGATWVNYTQTAAQHPRIRINVSVHLLDWRQARYVIKACNPQGCGSSSERGVDGQQLEALGFFKANSPTGVTQFGSDVAASADGRTVAVASGETLGSNVNSAVVHVYRKTTGSSGWRRQARLLPSVQQAQTSAPYQSDAIAISGDGNLVALGVSGESGGGAVYLFRYDGTAWRQAQRIVGTRGVGDHFGRTVKLDDAGTTLVLEQDDTDMWVGGLLEIYRASSSGAFTHAAQLTTPSSGSGGASACLGFAFSGDGRTLARPCFGIDDRVNFVQTLRAPTWTQGGRISVNASFLDLSFDGTQMLTQALANPRDLVAAWRLGPQGWVSEGSLASTSGFGDFYDGEFLYMRRIAISRDGKVAAIGSRYDRAMGLGPLYPPYTDSHRAHGGVVVHLRKDTGTWSVRRVLAPGSTNDGRAGSAIALGDNGRLLVVGAPYDGSAATGIDGNRDDDSMPLRGAVWLY